MPVDLSGQIFAAYERALALAKSRLARGAYLEAAAAYRECAHHLERYASYAHSSAAKARWLKKAEGYRTLASQIEEGKFVVPAAESPAPAEDYEGAIAGLIHKATVCWEDIGGLEETKQEIKAAYGLTLARKPQGVTLEGWRNILFYGPPGTGKTLLAAATSHSLDATFFNVTVSDLLSKYFGESTKLISALYDSARRLAPAVVFLDEFEALSPPRDGTQSGAEARIVSTFLAELDGLAQKGETPYVLTIAATNTPWLIDRAILSRFEKKIYIPLPDTPARQRILEIHLQEKGHHTQVPYNELVERTDGYSGREIAQLCKEAIKQMVERVNPDLAAVVDQGREAAAQYELQVQPIQRIEWEVAFARVRPQTTAVELERFKTWQAGLE